MTMIKELEKLFKYIKSKDREISELYLKLVLDKYEISLIEDYVFKFEPNIVISNNILPGVKSIIILFPYIFGKIYHYEYDTLRKQFLNSH